MDESNVLEEFLLLTPNSTLDTNDILMPSVSSNVITFSQQPEEVKQKSEFKWNVHQTKRLLDLFEVYKRKIGTLAVRTQKQMWHIIAETLKEELNINVTAENCHNRWRVLERNYKKYVDNETSTGRGRKFFEYTEEMELIFGGKKTVHPELLLCNEQMVDNLDCDVVELTPNSADNLENTEVEKPVVEANKENSQVKRSSNVKKRTIKKRKLA
ncbi:hypothetical protein NQ314_019800 [Rhamnusium bicolor]|uniref:Myb/SANT-like DNA-binding domain-containing protein n=1 Tax=Rhamnusium bicolor TaxID=1586634 RepID=A0AAV8WMP9_9CUCU|nr:hypothetical protein NQ314_019800 [Rhamnusium bicolor]